MVKSAVCLLLVFVLCSTIAIAQSNGYGKRGGNPIIPDLVADPSIVEIDGTFYCYVTTDGYGQGLAASGPPVVWKSKDFVHWSFTGICFPAANGQLYWAPSTVKKINGQYYLYPTVNRNIYAAIADSPGGPFRLANGNNSFTGADAASPLVNEKAPKRTKGIDAEVFIDDDGKSYMFWAQRGAARLKPDMITLDTALVISTKREGYSEGPFFFKRKGIYYYLYTLSGHENYQYAYIYSHISPLGPFEFPKDDIIAATDRTKGIYGPGHGSVFNVKGTDNYYFAYLEFGRGSTNRQVWVDKMEFNKDGTIHPVILTHEGVGALQAVKGNMLALSIQSVSASSSLPDFKVKPIKDSTLNRIESYQPCNAIDGSNGTRWMAASPDSLASFVVSLGKAGRIKQTDAYFVKPTAGHAYRLEYSTDGKIWKRCGGHEDIRIQSPHTDTFSITAQYLRITFLKGAVGLWEFKVWR
jgi:hypothetical protein